MIPQTIIIAPARLEAWAQRVLDICTAAGTCPCSRCRNPYQPAPGLCWRWAHARPWPWPVWQPWTEECEWSAPPRCLEWLPRGGRVRPRSGGRWHACADPPASVRRDWVPRCAPC